MNGATTFRFYQLNPAVAADFDLPAVPLPIRAEREQAVFGGPEVAFDSLLDELEEYLRQHPEDRDQYRELTGRLAYAGGVELGRNGFHEMAAYYLELGLALNPQNLSLRANYSVALDCLGRKAEALRQYWAIIDDPAVRVVPLIWVRAAGLAADLGNPYTAYRLLDAVADYLPEEDSFWELLAEMKERSGLGNRGVAPAQQPLESPAVAPEPLGTKNFCGQCGSPLAAGAQFCGSCGARL